MNWFKGDIPNAISLANSKGALFVVYIEGDDENSKKLTNIIDNIKVREKLESENFISIKIVGQSQAHQYFAEIFKNTSVPSVYFIGKDGGAMDIVTGCKNEQEFIEKLDEVCKRADLSIKSIQINDSNGAEAQSSEAVPNSATLTTEEKVSRAKEIIEKQQEEKRQAEIEKERTKELERRKMGQSLQEFKRQQEEAEMKQRITDHQREKRAEQEARERVLAQIAQDRRERAARYIDEQIRSEPRVAPLPMETPREPPATNMARIQFRLPNGHAFVHDFPATNTLQTLHDHIQTELRPSYAYTLSTTFPRREFTAADNQKSLLALNLMPSAVILVVPLNRAGTVSTRPSTTNTGGFFNMLWSMLFTPIFTVFGYVRTFIFGGGGGTSTTGTSTAENTFGRGTPPQGQTVAGDSRSIVETPIPSGSMPRRRIVKTHVIRKKGNVHGLADASDESDDESNTWNGNSTQQM